MRRQNTSTQQPESKEAALKEAVLKEFGPYLRDLRKQKRLNQQQLAEQVEVTGGYYGFFEQGRQIPSLKIINRLADVLDVDYFEMAQKAGYDLKEAHMKRRLPDEMARKDGASDQESRLPGDEESAQSATDIQRNGRPGSGAGSPALNGSNEISTERLNWALLCIANDPTYNLSDQYKQGNIAKAVQALLVRLYQSETRRQLLTPEESEALNSLVHG